MMEVEAMKYAIAQRMDIKAILSLKNQVKKRILLEGLPIWLDGYPSDELIIEDVERGFGRVGIENGNIICYASLYHSIKDYPADTFQKENTLSFGRIMVCNDYLGKHSASFLVSEMIKEAKRKSYAGIGILVDSCNRRALKLYEGYGFLKEGSRQFPYAYLDIYGLYF